MFVMIPEPETTASTPPSDTTNTKRHAPAIGASDDFWETWDRRIGRHVYVGFIDLSWKML
jgi:hypothetical protein